MPDLQLDDTQQEPGNVTFTDTNGQPITGLPAGVTLTASDPSVAVTLNPDGTFLLVPSTDVTGVVVSLNKPDGSALDSKTIDVVAPAPPVPVVASGAINLGTPEPKPGPAPGPVPPTPAP